MIIEFLDIPNLLIDRGVVKSLTAANSTAMYAVRWSQGEVFDLSNSQVALNRARLRKIGLDIAKPYGSPTGDLNKLIFQTNVKGFI